MTCFLLVKCHDDYIKLEQSILDRGERIVKHGNESFLIESEGLVEGPLLPSDFLPEKNGVRGIFSRDVKPKSDEKVLKPTRRFCRLFSQGDQPSGQSLIDLGNLMETEDGDTNDDRDSNIPAGYTYLVQFIDHDILSLIHI